MVKYGFYILGALILFSCIPTRRLEGVNGGKGNKVPYKGYKFTKGSKFAPSIYEVIDPNYFYELIGRYELDRKLKVIEDIGKDIVSVRVLQFYYNGRIRVFPKIEENPNPEKVGYRGVIYKQGNKTKIDFFKGVSQDGDMGIVTYQVWVEGDKLLLLERSLHNIILNEIPCYIYEKKDKVPEEWKQYKPDW
ncbi:MAG: hypothetical protein LBP34_07415 [Flavobacteriaceae bacterium]|jgi:hypothetical protein|nr:hypothetical protein [Flavobacteriaceae bacterium]